MVCGSKIPDGRNYVNKKDMNRVTPVLLYSLTGAAVLSSLSSCKEKKSEEVKKPMNVVYIMCDDHSYQTISAYDQRYMQTPNIDRIANEGVRFTNSFVANSLSGPSRACMLTGKHSHANGFTDNTTTFDGNQQTFPKLLQANGYQTAMIDLFKQALVLPLAEIVIHCLPRSEIRGEHSPLHAGLHDVQDAVKNRAQRIFSESFFGV